MGHRTTTLMTFGALILILAAAFIHASWNLFNKRASGHVTFTWLVAVLSAIFYTPLALGVLYVTQLKIGAVELGRDTAVPEHKQERPNQSAHQ